MIVRLYISLFKQYFTLQIFRVVTWGVRLKVTVLTINVSHIYLRYILYLQLSKIVEFPTVKYSREITLSIHLSVVNSVTKYSLFIVPTIPRQ